MKTSIKTRLAALAAAVAGTLASGQAQAVDVGGLQINGYGHQLYLKPSANKFLGADKDGSFHDNLVSLVVSARATERTTIWAQITANSGDAFNADWFYVDHAVNDELSLRAGKVLLPIGFYNEIIDARFLHRSGILPLLYQGATDLVDEAYGGAGLSLTKSLGGGRATFDVYGGHIVEHNTGSARSAKQKALLGGRVDFRTPVEGLRVMLSAATKRAQEDPSTPDITRKSALLSAEFKRDQWDLKGEFGRVNRTGFGPSATTNVYYVQGGYDFSDTWSAFVRNDSLRLPDSSSSNPASYQKSVGLGVTYKVNSGVSLRLEHHFIKGYGMAVLSEETPAGTGKEKWQMFGASVNFIF